jgi:hypothetical protein
MAGCVTPESVTRCDTGISACGPLFSRRVQGTASLGPVQEGGTPNEGGSGAREATWATFPACSPPVGSECAKAVEQVWIGG